MVRTQKTMSGIFIAIKPKVLQLSNMLASAMFIRLYLFEADHPVNFSVFNYSRHKLICYNTNVMANHESSFHFYEIFLKIQSG